jgi:hypothetical protein
MPARATPAPGHRMLKFTVVYADTISLASERAGNFAWTDRANALAPAAVPSYLSTHAFLI